MIRKSVQKMSGYVPGEQPGDEGVIKLNTNENPYAPTPLVAEVLGQLDHASLRLYSDPEAIGLRSRAAEIHGCGMQNVFIGNGSDEILALCTRAFVENDGVIGYLEPSYSLYSVLAAIREVDVRPVELPDDFAWPAVAGDDPALFFLTNPNTPSGVLYDKQNVRSLCRASKGVVVIDEAYVDFADHDCIDLAKELDNVIVVRSFSKSYSLAGVRMGYAVGHAELMGALVKIKDSYNTGMISQMVALAALNDQDHMRRNVEAVKVTRERLAGALNDRGFSVLPSQTNFLLAKPCGISAAELFEKLKQQRILVRYFAGGRLAEFIRISIGTDKQTDALVNAIDDITRCTGETE